MPLKCEINPNTGRPWPDLGHAGMGRRRHGGVFGRTASNFVFKKGPKIKGKYPHAGPYCRYCGAEVMQTFPFTKEWEALNKTSKSSRHRLSILTPSESLKGVTHKRSRAARKASAANKKKRVTTRTKKSYSGRHRSLLGDLLGIFK